MSSIRNRYRRLSKIRDGRLIVIASEGQETEPDYFDAIISSENYSNSGVHVLRRNSSNSSPRSVVRQLKTARRELRLTDDDELWIVIDRDKWKDEELNAIADECQNEKFLIALSNPCFELWLLMHFCDLCKHPNKKRGILCKNKNSLKKELTKNLKAKSLISFGMEAYMPIPFDVATQFRCNPPPNSGGSRHPLRRV